MQGSRQNWPKANVAKVLRTVEKERREEEGCKGESSEQSC